MNHHLTVTDYTEPLEKTSQQCLTKDFSALVVDVEQLCQEFTLLVDMCTRIEGSLRVLAQSVSEQV